MRIGIIGSGDLGGTLAELFEDLGHEILVGDADGGVADAAEFGEVVFLALPFGAHTTLPDDELAGKIVVDAMDYAPGRDAPVPELDAGEMTSSELLSRHLDGDATIVKAFNTIDAATLAEDGRPAGAHDRYVLFVAGDDDHAKRTVSDLIDELGFDVVDAGTLAEGGRLQQPGTPAHGSPMTALEAQQILA